MRGKGEKRGELVVMNTRREEYTHKGERKRKGTLLRIIHKRRIYYLRNDLRVGVKKVAGLIITVENGKEMLVIRKGRIRTRKIQHTHQSLLRNAAAAMTST